MKFAIDSAKTAINLQTVKETQNFLISTMPDLTQTRKQRFRAALALKGTTQEQWAELNGVSASHLSNVLSGRFPNEELVEKIDAYTAKHLTRVA